MSWSLGVPGEEEVERGFAMNLNHTVLRKLKELRLSPAKEVGLQYRRVPGLDQNSCEVEEERERGAP